MRSGYIDTFHLQITEDGLWFLGVYMMKNNKKKREKIWVVLESDQIEFVDRCRKDFNLSTRSQAVRKIIDATILRHRDVGKQKN